MAPMSVVSPRNGRHKCIVSYRSKQKHADSSLTCCAVDAPNQMSINAANPLCDKVFEQMMTKYAAEPFIPQELLNVENTSRYRLTLQPMSKDDPDLALYEVEFEGALDVFNHDLVCKLDEMTHKFYAPKINMTIEMSPLTSQACLVMGYLNFLMCVRLVDHSRSKTRHDLSPIFVQLISGRIDQIVADFMAPIRSGHGPIDPQYRDGLDLWYLYLKQIKAKRPKLDSCRIHDDPDLFHLVWKWCNSLDSELTERFKVDCKNGYAWDAAFPAQRRLKRDLKMMEFSDLSISFSGKGSRVNDLKPFESNQQEQHTATLDGSTPFLPSMDSPLPPSIGVLDLSLATSTFSMQQSFNSPSLYSFGFPMDKMQDPGISTNMASYFNPANLQLPMDTVNRHVGGYHIPTRPNISMDSFTQFSPSLSLEEASVSGAFNESYATSPSAFPMYSNLDVNTGCLGTCPSCCLHRGYSRGP